MKRCICLLMVLIVLGAPALAEVYSGRTAALAKVAVLAEEAGTVASVEIQPGQRVSAGDALVELKPERVFASQDGAVSLVSAEAGDAVDGEVLEVAPIERYVVHCTVDKAYQSAASTFVHSGETLYIKCTADGTHRAVGVIAGIDGEEYSVLTLGGELYVGETVYLYRDADFTADQRVGIGTVVVNDVQTYESQGKLTRLCVGAGDAVERGQLLYEVGGGEITGTVAGVVASVSCQPGGEVKQGQVVAEIVPEGSVGVEIEVDETTVNNIAIGDVAALTFAGEEDERAVDGAVVEIRDSSEPGKYVVRIQPQTTDQLPLGMSVEARFSF